MYQVDDNFNFITGGRHIRPPIDSPFVHEIVWHWNPFETRRTIGPMCSLDVKRVWMWADWMIRTQFPFWLDYVDEPDLATILRQHPPLTSSRAHWLKYHNHQFDSNINDISYVIAKASHIATPWWYRSDVNRSLLNKIGRLCGFVSWKGKIDGRPHNIYSLEVRHTKTWGAFGEPILDVLERSWRGMSHAELLYGVRQIQPMLALCIAEMRSL